MSFSLYCRGFEFQFGTNHMGHFALTLGLLAILKEAAKQSGKKSRVVNVSSTSHAGSGVGLDDINFRKRAYDPVISYGQSKTGNCLFSVHLAKLYERDRLECAHAWRHSSWPAKALA